MRLCAQRPSYGGYTTLQPRRAREPFSDGLGRSGPFVVMIWNGSGRLAPSCDQLSEHGRPDCHLARCASKPEPAPVRHYNGFSLSYRSWNFVMGAVGERPSSWRPRSKPLTRSSTSVHCQRQRDNAWLARMAAAVARFRTVLFRLSPCKRRR